MTTPAEQEAERRYPEPPEWRGDLLTAQFREAFEEGVEWSESRYRELLEAAREYLRAEERASNYRRGEDAFAVAQAITKGRQSLLAAAAALEEEGDVPRVQE